MLRAGPPVAQASAVAILIHGRGRTPEEMAALAQSLDMPEMAFIFPEAPGRSWYPKSLLHPLPENAPELSAAVVRLDAMIDDIVLAGADPRRLVVGGFSQGACVAAELVFRSRHLPRIAILWSGGLIGPPGTRWPSSKRLDGLSAFASQSAADPYMPRFRAAETAAAFADGGARIESHAVPGDKHQVSAMELALTRAFLQAALQG